VAYRILIVDDSPAMRAFVTRVLVLSGLEASACLQAEGGREALELLGSEWVDAILTDVNMPDMDGEAFLHELAAREELRAIPVIAISTDGTPGRIARLRALGARGYVAKPFTPEDLRAELEQSLGAVHG
jgi:two-component system, chemotaxis family, chemotaxis protein CheY